MGKIFPYSPKAAQSRLRAETKRKERERMAASSAAIWSKLADEAIELKRLAPVAKESSKPRERVKADPREAVLAVLDSIYERADTLIANLSREGPIKFGGLTLRYPVYLAACRATGGPFNSVTFRTLAVRYLRAIGCKTSAHATEAMAPIFAEIDWEKRRVRMAARDVIKNGKPEVRERIIQIFKKARATPLKDRPVLTASHPRNDLQISDKYQPGAIKL